MALDKRVEQRIKVGQNIRRIRLSLNLSLAKVAAKCNIDSADIGRYERADKNMELHTVLELAEALNVKPAEFFEGL
jgi:transcriptional regulator with XRE-family HTH domain